MAAMEGQLKKRGTKMPVMHDRYCVATWETDQALNKYVLLRSFKSQKNYLQSPAKPLSACTLKGFGDWDGKGNFRRYQHAFLMETREGQVFLCAAPSEAEKTKWLEFMSNTSPSRAPEHADTVADVKPAAAAVASNDGSAGPGLTLNKRLSMRFMTQALQNQASDTKTARESDEHDSDGYDSDVRSTTDDEFSLDEHLGLCDCKSPGSTQDGNDDNQDDNNTNANKQDCTTTSSKTSALDDSRESPRVQTRLSVSNEDALEALDAPTTPVARAARASPVSGLFDAEEAATIADFTQTVAPTPKAPALARTPVVDEATAVQTTSTELVNETPAASSVRVSSLLSATATPTEPRDAEPRAARPAPTAGVASAAVDPLETKNPAEPLVAPLPLQTKKSEAELAPPAKQQQQDAVVQVTERAAVAETVVSPAPIVAAPEASAMAAAPEAARTPVVTPASTPDVVAAKPSSAPSPLPARVVAPSVVEAPLSPKSPSVVVQTPPSSTPTPPSIVVETAASKTEPSTAVADAVAAPVVKSELQIETTKIELKVRPPVVAAAPTASVAAATASPALAAAPACAPATAVADAAAASTPTLPLAEEAEGSLSLPPLIAVRAVEPMPSEPSTPTARSASASQRLACTTPSELAADTGNDTRSPRPSTRSRSSSCSSSGDSPSPRRTRGRANSSVMPQSFEAFATPTRLRRYSFSSALAPVRASHAFTIGSPIKQTFLEPHLGYVRSGLSTMVPSFPGLLTTLTRQHSVDEREEFADQDTSAATQASSESPSASSSADIDEV